MAQSTNGGVVEAAVAALEDGVAGSLSSGLHHARQPDAFIAWRIFSYSRPFNSKLLINK
jgi:hypothetical protein